MSSASFSDLLQHRWQSSESLLCVGLDPDISKLPRHLSGKPDAIFEFCRQIVDATHDLVCAFKPQVAYFASESAEAQLQALTVYIKDTYPDVPVVLDAKRGDIGSTAEHYAREAFDRYRADAVTLSPYMGFDSIEPFLAHSGKGAIILCRTSNQGGNDLQFLDVGGTPLYLRVARMVADQWNGSGQCALVVGATYPNELAQVRKVVGSMPLLVPGIGTQGGNVEATVRAGATSDGGMMVNSSRAIIYAGMDENFAEMARAAAQSTRDALNHARPSVKHAPR